MHADAIATLIPALGWALLHFVWQGLVIGAVSALALAMLRGASPRWRYAVCALAVLLCLASPLATLALSLAGGGAAGMQAQDVALPAWRQQLQDALPSLVLAWALGASLMAARLSLGLAWVGRLRRRADPVPALWQARLDALALRMGLRRPVPLKMMASLAGPITFGFWRPVVLLPAALLSGMPVALVEALLAHELAHVRRLDYLANLLQSAVESLLFFHPVVWWLSTRMRAEREQVADELAAQALGDPHRLAEALHALSVHTAAAHAAGHASGNDSGNGSGLVMAARGGPLLGRIERLMLPAPQTAGAKRAWPAVLVACGSLLVQAAVPSAASHNRAPVVAAAAGAHADVASAGLLDLPVNARHVLVLDDAGKVLISKDADAIVPIASITKLMTAMVLLDAAPDPAQALRIVRADTSVGWQRHSLLPEGQAVPRAVMLQLALMASENRAAAALARTYPGGGAAFAQAVQRKIHSLGLTRTRLVDPVGVSPNNTSTAKEVAVILAAAARYPEIARITSKHQATVRINGREHELHNTNPLVGGKGWDIRLSKTGTSAEAGSCLSMRMRSGDRDVTVVLLDADGSERRSHDALGIRESLAAAPP